MWSEATEKETRMTCPSCISSLSQSNRWQTTTGTENTCMVARAFLFFATDRSLTVLCFIYSRCEGAQTWAGGHSAGCCCTDCWTPAFQGERGRGRGNLKENENCVSVARVWRRWVWKPIYCQAAIKATSGGSQCKTPAVCGAETAEWSFKRALN